MRRFKTILSTIVVLLCCISVSAHDFEVNGIFYNITSSENLMISVTFRGLRYDDYENEYSGAITIPSTVNYNGDTYRVTGIGDDAFHGCNSLTSIIIPEGVTSIGSCAFAGCSGLAKITIPESVTNIGGYAFEGCSGLTSITIPKGVTWISNSVFKGCSGITSMKVANGNTKYDSRNGCNAIIETKSNKLIAGCSSSVIAEGVTKIGRDAFNGCSGLTDITFPESVTYIEGYAFKGCSSLTNITIPESVTWIGESAFESCYSLTSINIPENVISIEGGVFRGCCSLTNIAIPEKLIVIRELAFEGCSSLTSSITIPVGVTSVGHGAFDGCISLPSIIIPENSKLTSIGSTAFRNCSGLTSSITIPEGVTSIGGSAFEGCSGLPSIIIPENSKLTSIENYAFADCCGLTSSITIPEWVTSIGVSAFDGCSGLTSIIIPENSKLTSIESRAFANCSGLTDITIPKGVTSIGTSAFEGCTGLISITIPESVMSIGYGVFCFCENLKDIYCYAEKVPMTDEMFFISSDYMYVTLYVPTNAIESYKTISPWSKFGNIVSLTGEKVTSITLSETTVTLTEGDELVLTAIVAPDYATDPSVVWSSNNLDVAAVDENGVIKAIAPGTATITATANDGSGVSASCEVTVKERMTSIVITDPYTEGYFIQDEDEVNINITYTRTLNNTEWNALYVPFEIPVSQLIDDYEVAYINGIHSYDDDDNGEIDRMSMEVVKVKSGMLLANHPYLIKARTEAAKQMNITVNNTTLYAAERTTLDCSSVYTKYEITGIYEQMADSELTGCYALSGGSWKQLASGSYLNPFRLYLRITSRGNSPVKVSPLAMIRIGIHVKGEESSTSFEELLLQEQPKEEIIYDLMGHRVENPVKGHIYIVNGKKRVY